MSTVESTQDLGQTVKTPRPLYDGIVAASKWLAFADLALMTVLMLTEVVMRYFAGNPLGWNVSLIEKVLLPGIVFLGMPYGYATAAHVTADLVYDRLPAAAQRTLRILSIVIVAVGLASLTVAGTIVAIETLRSGDVPPPLSSQLPIPSWIWRAFLPLGSFFALVLALMDAPRFIRGGDA